VETMAAKANMTSIRENLGFLLICIVQDEGLNKLYIHNDLFDCDELQLILKVIEHRIMWHA